MIGEFDVVCCLDVFEHVPRSERESFLIGLRVRMRPQGRIVLTTPLPAFTRSELERQPDRLQIIDEVVDTADLLGLASSHGLELQHYETYDLGKVGAYQYVELAAPQAWTGTSHPWSRGKRAGRLVLRLRRAVELPGLLTRLRAPRP